MKNWVKYKDYLERGDWHVHTNYSDGENTVFEYCEKAIENGLELIAFTEHVRRELTYNFDDFLADVYSAREEFSLKILVGCEAKVINLDGELDVTDGVLKKCDVVLGAFHGFPFEGKKDYLTALDNMLKNPDVDVWAHPTLLASRKNFNITIEEEKRIIKECIENEILIEKNIRYKLPGDEFTRIARELDAKFVQGSDSHKIGDLIFSSK